jgi:hypothetical protein
LLLKDASVQQPLFMNRCPLLVIPSSRLAETSRERNDKACALCNIEGRNRRVPQVSLLRPGIPQTNSSWKHPPCSLSLGAKPRDLRFRGPLLETRNTTTHTKLSSRPERSRISCHAALETTTCAAFSKESRMKFANGTDINRKSGVA